MGVNLEQGRYESVGLPKQLGVAVHVGVQMNVYIMYLYMQKERENAQNVNTAAVT